jgi:hypothetical protein
MGIEEQMHLHEVGKAHWLSLREHRARTMKYVADAIRVLGSDQVEEEDDKKMVIDHLGAPPEPARPLYLVTTKDDGNESVVYVGKTTARNRFSRGHSVALKLLAPEYQHSEKLVYRLSVTVLVNDDHVSLEWLDPIEVAEQVLDDVESLLIYDLQPPLNSQKKRRNLAKHQTGIHIQNIVEGLKTDSFLNDYII